MRNDARIMNKLHRRVFLDKIGMEDLKIYISFYVEASNRDAFMAVKQVGDGRRSARGLSFWQAMWKVVIAPSA